MYTQELLEGMSHDALVKLVLSLQLDQLTGLPRRDVAQAAAERRVVERGELLLVVDIDHFKRINDAHGHAVGDQVLVAVAEALRKTVRGHDLVSRHGGEEFLLCCKKTLSDKPIAERICKAVRMLHQLGKSPVPVTVSVGVVDPAAYRSGECTFGHFFKLADAALYQAKHEGRNCWRQARA